MRLKQLRVTNYKNVNDSTEFKADNVTCLVGKNEAGKTTLLRALYKLNPCEVGDGNYDRQNEYPRRYLLDFEERHPEGDAEVINTVWELSPIEVEKVIALVGPKGLTGKDITVTKGYANKPTWTLPIDESAVCEFVLSTSGLHAEELEPLKGTETLVDLKAKVNAVGTAMSERHKALLTLLKKNFPQDNPFQATANLLAGEMPKFLYFSNYDRMSGQVALEALQTRIQNRNTLSENDRVFMAFLGLVGVTIEDLAKQNQFEPLNARLEAASIKITKEIFEYWTQNRHLKVQFRLDAAQPGDPAPFNQGKIMRTRILNTHHDVTVAFDERSTGFVWFFSFLVFFSQVKKTFGNNLIILLDEPGLSLHAKAQGDLLRYFNEKIRPNHQLVYTTHSPFMVPSDDLLSVRTVEEIARTDANGSFETLGTKVGGDVLSTDRETLFPLQGALGYEVTQSLFIGEHTLLVEGPSDLLYLKVFSQELLDRKRTPLDKRWTVCPAGGVDKVGAFMSLFGGNKLHVATFIDYSKGQKKKVEELRKSNLLRKGHVFTAESYAKQDEADVEDVIGSVAYLDLVNKAYSLTGAKLVDAKKKAKDEVRVVTFVENHFKTLTPSDPEFDHYRPAEFMLENRTSLMKALPGIDAALDRFEQLFKDLNSLL